MEERTIVQKWDRDNFFEWFTYYLQMDDMFRYMKSDSDYDVVFQDDFIIFRYLGFHSQISNRGTVYYNQKWQNKLQGEEWVNYVVNDLKKQIFKLGIKAIERGLGKKKKPEPVEFSKDCVPLAFLSGTPRTHTGLYKALRSL
jgi:hypothetical protein